MPDPSFGLWPPGESGGVEVWVPEIAIAGTHDVVTGGPVNLYDGAVPGIILRFPATPADGTIVRCKESVNSGGAVEFRTQGGNQIEDQTGGFNNPSFSLTTEVGAYTHFAYDATANLWRLLVFYAPVP